MGEVERPEKQRFLFLKENILCTSQDNRTIQEPEKLCVLVEDGLDVVDKDVINDLSEDTSDERQRW